MLYEIEVTNNRGEGIFRAKHYFKPERKRTVTTDEMGLKELKACRNLDIKVFYMCKYCRKRFAKRRGLHTHINMVHPEYAHTI